MLALTCPLAQAVTFIDVKPANNSATITQVVLEVNSQTIIQNSEAPFHGIAPAPSSGTASVIVKSVRITDGAQVNLNLTFFNTSGAAVVNVGSHIAQANNIGVYDNGTITTSKSNVLAYSNALAGTAMDTDLRNLNFYDFVTPALPGPSSPVADADLLFLRSVQMNDYFMVSERWGNTSFNVTALMENGQPYAAAHVLRLGGPPPPSPETPTNVAYTAYDWNTGYAPGGNHTDQAQTLTIFSAREFFEGTNSLGGPIFGLRIDNDGEADFKIVGISADTFANDEFNSQVIPEPSALLMAALGSLWLVGLRKRSV